MVAPFLPEKEKVAAIRDELPATNAGIYLDTASAGPLPTATARAMHEWSERDLRLGRIAADADEEFAARADEARATLAAAFTAPIERVTLAPSVGIGLTDAAGRRTWRPGDGIVVASSLEPSVLGRVAAFARSVGAELWRVHGSPGADAAAIAEGLTDAVRTGTRLVVVPHVSPLDGAVLTAGALADLADRAHAHGASLAVDGSLAVGALAVDVPGSRADVYAAAGDRWLCGPFGTAAVYLAGGLGGPESEDARPLDAAAFHRAAVVGLARSAGWLAMQVGFDWAFVRSRRLLEQMASALAGIDGVSFVAAPRMTGTIVAFRLARWPAARLRDELGRRAFALVGVAPGGDAVRVSIGCWNTEDEIARLTDAVSQLAQVTPGEAARRRRTISVIGEAP